MPDKVVIVPYGAGWPELFRQTGSRLREALGGVALRIDHIGSTAVPGLDAKPVIDIQVSVASLEPADPFRLPLEGQGWVFRSANPDLSKRYFRERPGERRTHIHVRRAGSWGQQFALLFRDYLRLHDEDARRYAEVKRRLAREFGKDWAGYTEAKGPVIWDVMRKADTWAQSTGWQPGPSDA